ncbi:SLC13 family permease [Zobellella maritima]|uniref:SLC13 family permease n=1 Tax=Zobellella maritima TaxID=2059725 RepID=UPI000E309F6C|nr:SLC13 family permease [Zobellella maritima]
MPTAPPQKTFSIGSKGWILLADICLFAILLVALPFEPDVNKGLSLLICIAALWLTEAIHITITALMVSLLAAVMGILDTGTALSNFANPIIFLFLGGFALAAAMHSQGLDKLIANRILQLANAIAFGSGLIRQGQMMRAGVVLNLACIVVLVCYFYCLG